MKKMSFLNLAGLVLLFIGFAFTLIGITDHYILNINFYEKSGDLVAGSPGQELRIYQSLKDWIYLFSAAYLLFKLTVIAVLMNTALYLSGCQVPLKKVFRAVLCSEFIFFIPAAIKVWWFYHYYPNGDLSAWHHFYVLSLLSFFKDSPAVWVYPLQTLNVFEACYWFLLAWNIYRISGLTYDRSLRLVVTAYLPALIIWITMVSFCTLMLFPQSG